jgi:hypothetical protein
MKIKIVLLATLLLAFSSIAVAQRRTKPVDPNVIVKNLYAAQKAGSGPFFQTKSRAIVDKYFRKDLADLIWKDAVAANGEVGAIGFDPLFGSQDPQITDFVIMDTGWGGDSKFGPDFEAVVQVTFKDSGKERMVSYQFNQGRDKTWKIYDVHYRGNEPEVRLATVLKNAGEASYPKQSLEQLVTNVAFAWSEGNLSSLDARRPYVGSVRVVVEVQAGEPSLVERKTFRTLAQIDRWFKQRARGDGLRRNMGSFEQCSKGVCTFEQSGMLHNNLYLKKITYGMRKGRPYIKAIYIDDGA